MKMGKKRLRQRSRNCERRRQYNQKKKEEFFIEYMKLCKKYRCYVGGVFGFLTGCGVRKAKCKENYLENHLADLCEHLEWH